MTFLLRDFVTKIQEMFICLPKKEIFTRHTKKYTHDILTPLPMAFWPPTHGISTPLIHGILTHLPMVYWSPYAWYFDPSAYLLIRNEGVQFSIRGDNIPWMKIDPGVNLPWGSKYHMTPVLSSFMTYHGFVTILTRVPLVEQEQPTIPEFTRFLVGFVLLDL